MKQIQLFKYSYLCKVFLAGLYALFFLVQVLYNFDIADKKLNSNLAIHSVHNSKSHTSVAAKHSNKENKINIRLNKRFHPSFTPVYDVISLQVPIKHIEKNYIGDYSSESLFDVFLLTQSLRAPPVV
jgi:hypothetical protein